MQRVDIALHHLPDMERFVAELCRLVESTDCVLSEYMIDTIRKQIAQFQVEPTPFVHALYDVLPNSDKQQAIWYDVLQAKVVLLQSDYTVMQSAFYGDLVWQVPPKLKKMYPDAVHFRQAIIDKVVAMPFGIQQLLAAFHIRHFLTQQQCIALEAQIQTALTAHYILSGLLFGMGRPL